MRARWLVSCLLLAGLSQAAPLAAAELEVKIVDSRLRALENAVAVLHPVDRRPPPRTLPAVRIEQRDREFLPFVTVLQAGTRASFPNNDNLLHHVYSFSRAKTFEIKLYQGEAPSEVVFDTPGVVALGCNIHDWMEAYILVVESPHFARTDAKGSARLRDLPAGRYRLSVWHPHQEAEHPETEIVLAKVQAASVRASISVKDRPRKPKPAESTYGKG